MSNGQRQHMCANINRIAFLVCVLLFFFVCVCFGRWVMALAASVAAHIRLMSAERVLSLVHCPPIYGCSSVWWVYMVLWITNMCRKQSAIRFFVELQICLEYSEWRRIRESCAATVSCYECGRWAHYRVKKTNDANSVADGIHFNFKVRRISVFICQDSTQRCSLQPSNNIISQLNAAKCAFGMFRSSNSENPAPFLITFRSEMIRSVDCHLLHCEISVNNLHLFIINFSYFIAALHLDHLHICLCAIYHAGESIKNNLIIMTCVRVVGRCCSAAHVRLATLVKLRSRILFRPRPSARRLIQFLWAVQHSTIIW